MRNWKKKVLHSFLLGFLFFNTGALSTLRADESFGSWFDDLLKSLDEDKDAEKIDTPVTPIVEKVTISEPDKSISNDPIDLFLNPPVQTIKTKDREKRIPVKQARIAAKTKMSKFIGLLNGLEKKIEDIMEESFTPEFHDTYQRFYAGPNSIINITWDSIKNNEEFLDMFLVPKKDNKKLVKDLKEQRRTIVALTSELEELMPQVSLTPARTEEDKAKQLEAIAKEPSTQKHKRKTIETEPKKRGKK